MPRVYLAFDAVTEKDDYEFALNGWKYKNVIDELDLYLRNKWKYQDENTITIEECRNKIRELMEDL
jgi:hypothetical protein